MFFAHGAQIDDGIGILKAGLWFTADVKAVYIQADEAFQWGEAAERSPQALQ